MVHNENLILEEIVPGFHGMNCPNSGINDSKQCLCDECDEFLTCFPDWKEKGFYENMQSTVKDGAGATPRPARITEDPAFGKRSR